MSLLKTKVDILRKDIASAKEKNEMKTSSLKGVRNLSRSDLESILMYAEVVERNGTLSGSGLLPPSKEIKTVLAKYKII